MTDSFISVCCPSDRKRLFLANTIQHDDKLCFLRFVSCFIQAACAFLQMHIVKHDNKSFVSVLLAFLDAASPISWVDSCQTKLTDHMCLDLFFVTAAAGTVSR